MFVVILIIITLNWKIPNTVHDKKEDKFWCWAEVPENRGSWDMISSITGACNSKPGNASLESCWGGVRWRKSGKEEEELSGRSYKCLCLDLVDGTQGKHVKLTEFYTPDMCGLLYLRYIYHNQSGFRK